MILCTIWYHLHNLRNVKNIHGGVLLSVKLQAEAWTNDSEFCSLVTSLQWNLSLLIVFTSMQERLLRIIWTDVLEQF